MIPLGARFLSSTTVAAHDPGSTIESCIILMIVVVRINLVAMVTKALLVEELHAPCAIDKVVVVFRTRVLLRLFG